MIYRFAIAVLIALAAVNPTAAQQQLRPETAGTVSTFLVDVTGPETIPVGDLAVFDVGKSTATKFAWTIIPSSKNFKVDTSLRLAYLSGSSGTFTLVLVGTDAEGNVAIDTQTVVIGGKPTPDPDDPDPPPPPDPVVEGKRALLIIRESADSTPNVARMITNLRNPPHSDYLKSKGHTLHVFDDDAVDADGKPSPQVEAWRPHFAGMTLPVVFVVDQNGNKLIHKESLPATAGADAVMGILKKFGG